MNKVTVVGPMAKGFLEAMMTLSTNLKFCVVAKDGQLVLVLFKSEAPLTYHNHGVQLFMNLHVMYKIVVRGGGQATFDAEKKTITVYEQSKAFGWTDIQETTELFKIGWPEYEIIFINDDERVPVKEEEVQYDADTFSKIENSGVRYVDWGQDIEELA